jgi:hypothetical protein
MSCTRKQFVAQMQTWVGLKESDKSHRQIIDIYNTIRPLPRSYKLTYWDAWCAGAVSAAAKACNALDIIPAECSCPYMISHAQKMGIWVEADNYIPAPGDIIMYDWQDSGSGDNRGGADHVGVVEVVSGNNMTIIEGNYSDSVKRRPLQVNGRYIRGYIVPKFDADTNANDSAKVEPVAPVATEYTLKQFIKDVQSACGAAVDGIAGPETISKTVTLSAKKNARHATVKAVQKRLQALGYVEVGEIDGIAGPKFTSAVAHFQQDNGCVVDGEITARNKTWRKLLGMG